MLGEKPADIDNYKYFVGIFKYLSFIMVKLQLSPFSIRHLRKIQFYSIFKSLNIKYIYFKIKK